MRKRRLSGIAFLALIISTLCVRAMEQAWDDPDLETQPDMASFVEKVQVYGLPSPNGLFVARSTYSTSRQNNLLVNQKEMKQWTNRGYYPWNCHINICMAAGGEVVGAIAMASTILQKIEWLEGHQLRILATACTGAKQLQWFDCVYTLDGTWINNGMDQILKNIMDRAQHSILPSS